MQPLIQRLQTRALTFIKRLSDVKFAGQIMFLVIVLLISWSGVKSIQSNYILQKQIANLQQQNQIQQLSNNNLQLENQYYNTETYLDVAARRNFGIAAPGEKEIIVPKDVALSYTTPLPKPAKTADAPVDKQSSSQRNVQAWVNFFLHRPTGS